MTNHRQLGNDGSSFYSLIILLLFFDFSTVAFCQNFNLVKNPGFELNAGCPDSNESLRLINPVVPAPPSPNPIQGWVYDWQGTDSELLMDTNDLSCKYKTESHLSPVDPVNQSMCPVLGINGSTQNKFYAGIFTINEVSSNNLGTQARSEYIGGALTDQLLPKIKYEISIDVALGKYYPNSPDAYFRTVIKNFQWLFINEQYTVPGHLTYDDMPLPPIPAGDLNGGWVESYFVPPPVTNDTSHFFTFDSIALQSTPNTILSHPFLGKPNNTTTDNHIYNTWFTIKKIYQEEHPAPKDFFLVGVFRKSNYVADIDPSFIYTPPAPPTTAVGPSCNDDPSIDIYCQGGGMATCENDEAVCPNSNVSPICGYPGQNQFSHLRPKCPLINMKANAYHYLDNFKVTCRADIKFNGIPVPNSHTSKMLKCNESPDISVVASNSSLVQWRYFVLGAGGNICLPPLSRKSEILLSGLDYSGNTDLFSVIKLETTSGTYGIQNAVTLGEGEKLTLFFEGVCHKGAKVTSPFEGDYLQYELERPEAALTVNNVNDLKVTCGDDPIVYGAVNKASHYYWHAEAGGVTLNNISNTPVGNSNQLDFSKELSAIIAGSNIKLNVATGLDLELRGKCDAEYLKTTDAVARLHFELEGSKPKIESLPGKISCAEIKNFLIKRAVDAKYQQNGWRLSVLGGLEDEIKYNYVFEHGKIPTDSSTLSNFLEKSDFNTFYPGSSLVGSQVSFESFQECTQPIPTDKIWSSLVQFEVDGQLPQLSFNGPTSSLQKWNVDETFEINIGNISYYQNIKLEIFDEQGTSISYGDEVKVNGGKITIDFYDKEYFIPGKTYRIRVTGNSGDDYFCNQYSDYLVKLWFRPRIYFPNVMSLADGASNNGNHVFSGFISKKQESYLDNATIDCMIADRWGEIVYQTKDPQFLASEAPKSVRWDGNFRGNPVNPGVFVFYCKVTFAQVGVVEYKGDVTVIN